MDSVDFAALDFLVGAIADDNDERAAGRLEGGGGRGTCWRKREDGPGRVCGRWLQFMIKVQIPSDHPVLLVLGIKMSRRLSTESRVLRPEAQRLTVFVSES